MEQTNINIFMTKETDWLLNELDRIETDIESIGVKSYDKSNLKFQLHILASIESQIREGWNYEEARKEVIENFKKMMEDKTLL